MSFLFWFFVLILLVAASFAGWWAYRVYVLGETNVGLGGWFGPKPEPRLGVTEQASVDSRRRLVLVRRDNVEHLIMTGVPRRCGNRDEYRRAPRRASRGRGALPARFSRQSRAYGQAVNE